MATNKSDRLERRTVLKALGVAGGLAATGVASAVPRKSVRATREAAPEPAVPSAQPTVSAEDADPRAYFGAIVPGARIGRWTVASVHPVRMGAIAVVLQTQDGAHFQVDVLRKEAGTGGSHAIASTAHVSVYLLNEGDGRTATTEEHGLGAMALARALARRERGGARPPALLSLVERNERFPRGAFRVTS